jgi:hypothetical protein
MDWILIASWVPTALSIIGVFMAGSERMDIRRAGFEIGFYACVTWILWAIWIRPSPELIITNIVMGAFYVRAVWNNTCASDVI